MVLPTNVINLKLQLTSDNVNMNLRLEDQTGCLIGTDSACAINAGGTYNIGVNGKKTKGPS